MTAKAQPDTDTAARKRIQAVTAAVMQKAAESLNAMANQIITNVREDEKFLGAILTPGVNLELDLQVPDDLENKIMVLIAECVALDRAETLDSALDGIMELRIDCGGCYAVVEDLHTAAEAEVSEITKAANKVRASAAPKAGPARPQAPGVVLPQGLVGCPKCGGAAKPLSKCVRCGEDVGIKL